MTDNKVTITVWHRDMDAKSVGFAVSACLHEFFEETATIDVANQDGVILMRLPGRHTPKPIEVVVLRDATPEESAQYRAEQVGPNG